MQDIGPSGLVRDQDPADIADLLRLYMLIGQRVALDGADMDAALVGKGRLAHIGLEPVMLEVGQFIDQTGSAVQPADVFPDLTVEPHFEDQGRDD